MWPIASHIFLNPIFQTSLDQVLLQSRSKVRPFIYGWIFDSKRTPELLSLSFISVLYTTWAHSTLSNPKVLMEARVIISPQPIALSASTRSASPRLFETKDSRRQTLPTV